MLPPSFVHVPKTIRHRSRRLALARPRLLPNLNPKKKLKEFPNTLLDLTSGQRTVDEGYWKNALAEVWKGLKKRNVEPYSTGLIHRPKSETPGDAVSEGVGYGMLTALFANDQQTFNQIWEAGNKYMWSLCYYSTPASVTNSGCADFAH